MLYQIYGESEHKNSKATVNAVIFAGGKFCECVLRRSMAEILPSYLCYGIISMMGEFLKIDTKSQKFQHLQYLCITVDTVNKLPVYLYI